MARKDIGVGLNRDNRNAINHNFIELYGSVSNIANTITDEVYSQIIDGAKLNWLNPVYSYEKLPKDAKKGDTVMTREDGKVYRFDGEEWIEIQQIDVGPVNELDSRLSAQLAKKADVVKVRENTDIRPINVKEMDTETKQLFTGGAVAVVGADAIGIENLKKGSLIVEKTTGYKTGKNLFEASKSELGYLVASNGTVYKHNVDNKTSEFIEVVSSQKYTWSMKVFVCFYDANRAFISAYDGMAGGSWSSPLTLEMPVNTKYLRFSYPHARPSSQTLQLEKGVIRTAYEPFVKYTTSFPSVHKNEVTGGSEELFFENGKLSSVLEKSTSGEVTKHSTLVYSAGILNSITERNYELDISQKTVFEYEFIGGNLFIKEASVPGLLNDDGVNGGIIYDNKQGTHKTSDFILVEPSTNYTSNVSTRVAFYTIAKEYISTFDTLSQTPLDSPKTYTSPSNAGYMRVSVDAERYSIINVQKGNEIAADQRVLGLSKIKRNIIGGVI